MTANAVVLLPDPLAERDLFGDGLVIVTLCCLAGRVKSQDKKQEDKT